MKKFLHGGSMDLGLLFLRLGFGGMMLYSHGWPKAKGFSDRFHTFSDPLGVGSELSYILIVFAEFICAVLLMVGLFTRFAAIAPLIAMLVAAFIVHADDPWGKQEFPLLFAISFLVILIAGPGKYSLDRQMLK